MVQLSEEALYRSLVRANARDLHRFALRLCGGRSAAADDLVQDTFQEAWKSIDKLRNPDKGRAWLFQILRHRHVRFVRDDIKQRRLELVAQEQSTQQTDPTDLPNRDAINRAVDKLDEKYRVPFLMVFLEGATCQQTADALELPLGTVLSRIHRARTMLRERLKGVTHFSGPRLVANGGRS